MFRVIDVERINDFVLLWLDKTFDEVPESWDKKHVMVQGELYQIYLQHNFRSILLKCDYSKAISLLGKTIDFV